MDSGISCVTRTKIAGLGFKTSLTYTTWDRGRQVTRFSRGVVIPDQGAARITEKRPAGKILVLVLCTTLIDATGKPVEFASR